jgi:uncharacterized protein YbjT (DUF2867 family)
MREQGQVVRCLVRPGSNGDELRSRGAEVVAGDLANPATLAGACDGAEAVVATATVIGRRLAGARRPSIREVDQVGMSALVDAAEAASVERFVYVSFAGADAQLGTPLERAKIATEQRLRRSSMRSVIVRPDAFQDIHLAPIGRFDIAAGKVAVFGKGDTRRRWVSTDDVAALVAALAVEPDPPAMVEFGGPEALSRNEAIAVAEQVIGRAIKRQRLPRPVTRLGMRLLARPNDALASVFGAGLLQDLVASSWDDAPLQERGINAKSASQFIRQQAGSAE